MTPTMTRTPQDIRRRFHESLSILASNRRMWELAQQDHETRMADIQSQCPHENVGIFVGEYTQESHCADCGKLLSH
jgi:hypothetical protein